MLRSLGIYTLIKWFAVACIVIAVWRGYHGDVGAIVSDLWSLLLKGADLVTYLWHMVNSF